jgi:hypothetical protein
MPTRRMSRQASAPDLSEVIHTGHVERRASGAYWSDRELRTVTSARRSNPLPVDGADERP